MGRKSKLRRRKREEDFDGTGRDLMALGLDDEADRPMTAKQSSKMKKKLRKQMRKQAKQEKDRSRCLPSPREKGKPSRPPRWQCIKVFGEEKIDKNFLYTSIGNFVDVEFQPLGFHKRDRQTCFYLENNEQAASAIGGLSKRLQGSDGTLLSISVMPCRAPELVLNSDQVEVLKNVLARRFNESSSLLDLTSLHQDTELVTKDILAALTSPMIFKQVLKIIKENIPYIKALNLSKNNLTVSSLKVIESLQTGNSQLNALNLGHNCIGDIQVLKCIKMFPLTELSLEFNPLVDHYKQSPVKYVTVVKRELPSLKLMDGVDVDTYLLENGNTKLIQDPRLQLPNSEGSSASCSSAVSEEMVRGFLEQYYSLIDTPQRSDLVAAYTPDAVLRINSSIDSIGASNMFVGQDKIREALVQLPATQHQPSSFSLDVKLLNTSKAEAVVKGQCQIAGIDSVVNFSHAMNIVSFNAGLCCSEAMLEIR